MDKEKIDYWHNPALPDVELSLANVKHFEFDRHIHLDYHIGVVSTGCQQYLHQGSNYLLGKGLLSTINPDEMHNGHSDSPEGYAAHIMAIPPECITEISLEMKQPEAFFNSPLIDDPYLYNAFLYLHRISISNQSDIERLQLETTMMAFVTELLQRHGGMPLQSSSKVNRLSCEQLNQIKMLFHDDPSQSFQLHELAEPLGLSKFQFLRQFKQSMGMTPHAYFKRVRLEYAKKALIKGGDVSDVAYQVGFFDQSHLSKAFKQAYLVTPAHFQRRVL